MTTNKDINAKLNKSVNQKQWRIDNPERVRMLHKRWIENNKERDTEIRRKRHHAARITAKGISMILYRTAKKRAIRKKIDFLLTREWIEDKITKGKCEMTGLDFCLNITGSPLKPSLDRTDTNGGYTIENVKVVVWIYNMAKFNFTHNDVLIMAKALTNCAHKP